MPDISAFRGIRYDLGHVGSLSDVVAPPYDVIDSALQNQLYKSHPANCVRLILNRDEQGDDSTSNRYTRASRFLRNWLREGVLFVESDPALYVYHQQFEEGGQTFTRRGFMCRTRLERFGEGNIHPHEQTHGGAKADRLKLWQATKANLSQIFGLYPDPENEAQQILDRAIAGQTPYEATDHLGVRHRIWTVTDVQTITAVTGTMGGKPIYIADGHHRYETACTYRDELAARQGGLDREHPANFVLMMCVSTRDSGMLVLPTHRLFRGLPPITSSQLRERLGDAFTLEHAGQGPQRATTLWEEIELEGEQGTLGLYTAEDEQWVLARITDRGRAKLATVSGAQSTDWQGLGVSILHRLVIDTLLAPAFQAPVSGAPASEAPASGAPASLEWSLPAPKYVRAIEEVVDGLTHGDSVGRDLTGQQSTGGRFELAAMVMPASLEHIQTVSEHGERMPAKSTYFYPKLLSGLVFNPLE